MHKLQNEYFPILMCMLFIFLSGCGQGQDIENLSLVIGSALDLNPAFNNEENAKDITTKSNIVTKTVQVILPVVMTKSQGSPSQKPYENLSITGNSIHELFREGALRRNSLFGAHQKIIVVGESLARKISMQKILDIYIRDNEIRRSCAVVIAKGLAKDILEIETGTGVPVNRLMDILDNQNRTNRMLPTRTLGKVSSYMTSDSSFLLQNVLNQDKKLKLSGASIIKGNTKKLIGSITAKELEGWNWITGEGEGGIIKARHPNTSEVYAVEIRSIKSAIKPIVKGNKIMFDVKIKTQGRLSEDWAYTEKSFDSLQLKKSEQVAEKTLKNLVQNTLNKIQKEYKVDVFGFGQMLYIHYPKVWQKVKTQWDKEFSRSTVKINVDLTIEDFGSKGKK